MSWRIRCDETGKLILQIGQYRHRNFGYGYQDDDKMEWRDAKVEDIPVSNPFDWPRPEPCSPGARLWADDKETGLR